MGHLADQLAGDTGFPARARSSVYRCTCALYASKPAGGVLDKIFMRQNRRR